MKTFCNTGSTYKSCTRLSTPATESPICSQLFSWASKKPKYKNIISYEMSQTSAFQVYYWNEETKKADHTICYSSKAGEHGWCGTCYEGK